MFTFQANGLCTGARRSAFVVGDALNVGREVFRNSRVLEGKARESLGRWCPAAGQEVCMYEGVGKGAVVGRLAVFSFFHFIIFCHDKGLMLLLTIFPNSIPGPQPNDYSVTSWSAHCKDASL